MIDSQTFEKELAAIENNLSEIRVGSFSGFTHVACTPAHTFHTVDLYVPELGFLHIVARDSFRQDLLEQLVAEFERTRIKQYKKNMLYVYKTYDLEGFDCIGLAPPPLAKIYDNRSKKLAEFGYQLFPMHGIEFLHKFSEEQFWTQRRRRDNWKVCILDWNRSIVLK